MTSQIGSLTNFCWKEDTKILLTTSNLIGYYKANFDKISANYIFLSGRGTSIPWISLIDFSHFARTCNFMDSNLPTSTIDRFFIAANVHKRGAAHGDNPDKSLARLEFFELLVRIAHEKFI